MADTQTSRLRQWREQQNLTILEVSDLTGISPSMLSRVETGDRHLSPHSRVVMARRLRVRVADLFELDAADEPPEVVAS